MYKTTDIGTLPSNWEIRALPNLLSFIVDNRGRTVPTSESGIPLIATNCIKENALYPIKEKLRFLSQETYDTWFRSHPEPNDIIFVNKGTPGQVCLVPNPVDFCIAQDMVALRTNGQEIDWKFLFAYLRSPMFKKQVEGLNVGTTIPHLKKSIFNQLLIPIPPKQDQETIGEIYYQLSNKIELNLQMNQTLESIAQALFTEWFMKFNFPGFDGELIDGLPKGWSRGTLKDICSNIRKPFNPKQTEIDAPYIGLEHIPRQSFSLWDWGHSSEIDSQKSIFTKGDILFGKLRPYFHKVIIAPIHGICSTDILVIRSNNNFMQMYSLMYLSSNDCVQYATSYSDGTRMPRVNWDSLSKYPIILPSEEALIWFQNWTNPLLEKIYANIFENQTLTQLRDALLPKLMSGKIRIQ